MFYRSKLFTLKISVFNVRRDNTINAAGHWGDNTEIGFFGGYTAAYADFETYILYCIYDYILLYLLRFVGQLYRGYGKLVQSYVVYVKTK